MTKMLGFDLLKEGMYWLYEGFFQIFYFVWRCIAIVVDIMESVFQMLIGLKPLQQSKAPPIEQSGVDASAPTEFKDLPSWIIGQPVISTLFQNLAVFAVILLMFFTVIVIIREQYKNKDGGNPYLIVFRSFKGIIMLLFITGAVLVGLYASGVILTGLNKITRLKDDDSVSGQIFYAMAQRANRYNFYSAKPSEVSKLESAEFLDVIRAKRKQEIMQGADGIDTTSPYYFVDTVPVLGNYKVEDAFTPYLVAGEDYVVHEYTYVWQDRGDSGHTAEGHWYKLIDGSKIDVTGKVAKIYPTKTGSYNNSTRKITQPSGFGFTETAFETEGEALNRWRVMLSKLDTYKDFVEDALANSRDPYTMAEFLIHNAGPSCVNPTLRSKSDMGNGNVERFTIWIPELLYTVKTYATGNEPKLQENWNERKQKEGFRKTTTITSTPTNTTKKPVWFSYKTAALVDAQMMRKYREGMKFDVYLFRADAKFDQDSAINEGEATQQGQVGGQIKALGPMTYFSTDAVIAFYDLTYFNFIIGFLGILMVAGVYMSFVFGLLQRAMELVVLYVLSPLTIATYPFDDGASFNNNFVRPFYKKVISVYAVVLSLNIFFLIYPVFNRITFFEPLGENGLSTNMGDYLMQIFVTLAVVGMLPKMRSTITGMLGADSIEERGVGQVFNDARAATWGNQNFKDVGRAAKFAANQTAGRAHRGYKKYSAFKEANQPKALAAKQASLNEKVRRGELSQEEANAKLKAFREKQIHGGAISQAMGKIAEKTGLAKAGKIMGSAGQSILKSNIGQALFDQNNGALKDWKMVKFARSNSAAEKRKEVKKIRDGQLAEEIEMARSHGERAKAATGLGQEFAKVNAVEAKMAELNMPLSSINTAQDYEGLVAKLQGGDEKQQAAAVYLGNRKDDYFKAQSAITTKSSELGLNAKQAQALGAAYSNTVGAGRTARHKSIEADPNNIGKSANELTKLKQDSDFAADQEWTRHVSTLDADRITAYADAKTNSDKLSGVHSAAAGEKVMEIYGDAVTKLPPAMQEAIQLDAGLIEIRTSDDPHKHMKLAEQLRMLAEDPDNPNCVVGEGLRELVRKGGNKVAYQLEQVADGHDMIGSTTGVMTGMSAEAGRNAGAVAIDIVMTKKTQELLETQLVQHDNQISNSKDTLHNEIIPELSAHMSDRVDVTKRADIDSSDLGEIASSVSVLDVSTNTKRRECIKLCETHNTNVDQTVLHEMKQADEIATKFENGLISESEANRAFAKIQSKVRKNMPSEIHYTENLREKEYGSAGLTFDKFIKQSTEPGAKHTAEFIDSARQMLADFRSSGAVEKDVIVSLTKTIETQARINKNEQERDGILEKKSIIDNSLSKYEKTIKDAMKED